MHIFGPVKLKKEPVTWYVHRHSNMLIHDSKPTHKVRGQIITGEKHEAMIQPLWYFPYSLQIIKCSKHNLAIDVCGNMIKDLYHLRIWKKDDIILTLRFFKSGFILHGLTKYRVDKKRKGFPHES